MKLGTERNLYQTTYSYGTCMDDKIRQYYNTVGGIVFGFSTLVCIILLFLYFGNIIFEFFKNTLNTIYIFRPENKNNSLEEIDKDIVQVDIV